MNKIVDYYLSCASPWTYLGHPRFADMVKRHGAEVRLRPADFGRIFAVSGGLPLKQRPVQRLAYRNVELRRWKAYLNDPIKLEPRYFPVDATDAGRLVIAAEPLGVDIQMRLAYAVMRAVFVEERDIASRATLLEIVRMESLPLSLVEESQGESVRGKYDAYTQEAIERQVFGAPTYLLDGEPFWGQDRLDFVERALVP